MTGDEIVNEHERKFAKTNISTKIHFCLVQQSRHTSHIDPNGLTLQYTHKNK